MICPDAATSAAAASALQVDLAAVGLGVLVVAGKPGEALDLPMLAAHLLDKPTTAFGPEEIEQLFGILTGNGALERPVVLIISGAEALQQDAVSYLRLLPTFAAPAAPRIVFVGLASSWQTAAPLSDLITASWALDATDSLSEPAATPQGAPHLLVKRAASVAERPVHPPVHQPAHPLGEAPERFANPLFEALDHQAERDDAAVFSCDTADAGARPAEPEADDTLRLTSDTLVHGDHVAAVGTQPRALHYAALVAVLAAVAYAGVEAAGRVTSAGRVQERPALLTAAPPPVSPSNSPAPTQVATAPPVAAPTALPVHPPAENASSSIGPNPAPPSAAPQPPATPKPGPPAASVMKPSAAPAAAPQPVPPLPLTRSSAGGTGPAAIVAFRPPQPEAHTASEPPAAAARLASTEARHPVTVQPLVPPPPPALPQAGDTGLAAATLRPQVRPPSEATQAGDTTPPVPPPTAAGTQVATALAPSLPPAATAVTPTTIRSPAAASAPRSAAENGPVTAAAPVPAPAAPVTASLAPPAQAPPHPRGDAEPSAGPAKAPTGLPAAMVLQQPRAEPPGNAQPRTGGISASELPQPAASAPATPLPSRPAATQTTALPQPPSSPAARTGHATVADARSIAAPAAPPTRGQPAEAHARPASAQTPVSLAPPAGARAPRTDPPEIAALVARGDVMRSLGDYTAARLLYERAAKGGSGRAAAAAGRTYDPAFLAMQADSGPLPDPDKALAWYRRAADLGDADAPVLLARLLGKPAAN